MKSISTNLSGLRPPRMTTRLVLSYRSHLPTSWNTTRGIPFLWNSSAEQRSLLTGWAISCGGVMKPRACPPVWKQLSLPEVDARWVLLGFLDWYHPWLVPRPAQAPGPTWILFKCFQQYRRDCALWLCCVCFPEQHGRGGGGHGPGGLEGQVYGPGGAAHEVQNANHQDPRADCWQGRSRETPVLTHQMGETCLWGSLGRKFSRLGALSGLMSPSGSGPPGCHRSGRRLFSSRDQHHDGPSQSADTGPSQTAQWPRSEAPPWGGWLEL